jgi:hypothetical protein
MSSNNFQNLGGWIHNPAAIVAVQNTLKHPVFGASAGAIKESGKGRTVLLFKFVEKLIGNFNVRTQAIGDCCSFGAAAAVDLVKATEIILKGEFEEWIAETSTEDIYGGSRVNVGNGQLGDDDGSYGAWISKYVKEFGTLVRKDYGNIDLSRYSGNRAKEWGSPGHGVPSELLGLAKEHRIRTVSQINTYEECRDALANGYAITICSNQGFSNTRDSEGFAAPQGEWAHCMCLSAVDDIGVDCSRNRPGCLIQNSWGKWNQGPKRLGQPDGSFWVDAEVLEERILSMGDSWSYSSFDGYEIQKLNLDII